MKNICSFIGNRKILLVSILQIISYNGFIEPNTKMLPAITQLMIKMAQRAIKMITIFRLSP